MKCASCQHENESSDKFCSECGSPLAAKCATCTATLKSGAKFCSECGASAGSIAPGATADPSPRRVSDYTPAHLVERIRAEQAALDARGAADGERKTITALFADLKGSTTLMEGLDPEEARAIIDPALQIMMDAVHQFEGYVAQALGDGIFALFGAPIAVEDHAHRAVYAALAMQREMRSYSDTLRRAGSAPLDLRVGINTGDVVLRDIRKDDLHTDYVPVGHSTNLAARAEQLASPGTVVITEYTHRLVEGFFTEEALGPTVVKGVEVPIALYEVISAADAATRLKVAAARGLRSFVGRHGELEQLRQLLMQAQDGRGQVIGIMGEPGLGKSRLLHEFKTFVPSDWRIAEAHGVSFGKTSAYFPIVALLQTWFDLQSQDDLQTRRAKVIGQVLALDPHLQDILPFVLELLGLEDADKLAQMDAQIRRRRTHDALRRLWLRASTARPLLLVVEDLHWIDAETQSVLDNLVEHLAAARLMLVTNYRPEYQHVWNNKTYYSQLRLAPLRPQDGGALLDSLLGDDVRLSALKRAVLDRSEGTPFFIEEVVQSLVEQGVLKGLRGAYQLGVADPSMRIPTTVQGVLAARIDRLPAPEKELLQELATIGREFSWILLCTAIPRNEEELGRSLTVLQNNEFIYPQATAEPAYIFKHALTQEVAYSAILLSRRKELHERVGRALESLHALQLDEHYATLAHHYTHSDNIAKAVTYLKAAGIQAAKRCAFGAAKQFLGSALRKLSGLQDSAARDEIELDIQLWRGVTLHGIEGLASHAASLAYERAGALAVALDRKPEQVLVKHGETVVAMQAARIGRGEFLAADALAVALTMPESPLHAQSYSMLGVAVYWRGQLQLSLRHLEQSLALYKKFGRQYSNAEWANPEVSTHGFAAKSLRLLGQLDSAAKSSEKSINLARELAHPSSLAFAMYSNAVVLESRRDWVELRSQAQAEVALAEEYGFPLWRAWGHLFLGVAQCEAGKGDAGLQSFRDALAEFEAIDSQLLRPYCLALFAEANSKLGDPAAGLVALDEALERIECSDERHYEAEVHRLYGELLVQVASPAERMAARDRAEQCFTRAIEIARGQEAKLLELRAAMSLVRLWQSQGKFVEAHAVLAPIYGWFTEGFETRDLIESKALLVELSAAQRAES